MYRYRLSNIIFMIMFYTLYEYNGIKSDWVYFYCGFFIPVINMFIFKGKLYKNFPWEVYIYLIYISSGVFFHLNGTAIYGGLGYLLSRVFFYFKVNKNNGSYSK